MECYKLIDMPENAERRKGHPVLKSILVGTGRSFRAVGRMGVDLLGITDMQRIPSARDRHQAGINRIEAFLLHWPMPALTKALSYHHDPHVNLFKGVVAIIGGTALDVAAYATIPHTAGLSLVAERAVLSGGSGVIQELQHGSRRGTQPRSPAHR